MATTAGGRVTGTVSVEPRAKGRVWVASYRRRDGRKVRKTLGMAWVRDGGTRTARGAVIWRANAGAKPGADFLTPKEAQEKLDALLHVERTTSRPTAPTQRTKNVEDVIAKWLHHSRTVKGVSDATYRSYVSNGNRLRTMLGATTAARALTDERIRELQDEMLEEELARSTVHHHMVALRRALQLAVGSGWLEQNPADEVEIVPLPKVASDFNVLEPSQVEAVAQAVALVPEDELPTMRNGKLWEDLARKVQRTRALWSEIIRIAAYTGLRMGELRALRWGDVDLAGSTLRVALNLPSNASASSDPKAPKSGDPRSVPLIPEAVAALRRTSKLGHPTKHNDLVFPSLEGGPFDGGRVRSAFYAGLKTAGLGYMREKANPMTFHDLRHTFGTIAARVFPLADVQAYLGHSDIGTTMRYAHHVPRTDAAKQLAKAFAADLQRVP